MMRPTGSSTPRPNVLWVSDFTDVATWTGFVYVAFVIDDASPCVVERVR
jgi:putative transposase